jgi:mannose/fructose/N-acetylgalactosamine-specific phosphotransferase system component IIC
MILVKSIFAGLVAVMGAIIPLLSFALLFHYVIIPKVLHVVFAGRGNWMVTINMPGAAALAAMVFLLGFGWELRRVKAHQAN